MTGKRIAIIGAGRSGIAVARAAKSLGATPTVFDSRPLKELDEASSTLEAEDVPLRADFKGSITSVDADILVTSPGVDSRSALLRGAVQSGVEVIGEIEFAARIAKAPIVAVTGTNGKSTTTVMTWLCLRGLGRDAILCGNIFGSGYAEMPLTEGACYASKDQVLVAEISSFQLEWVSSFRPRCAAITNIVPDHLNRYDSFEDYSRAKHRIYAHMGPGDCFVYHSGELTRELQLPDGVRTVCTDYDDEAIRIGEQSISVSELPFMESHIVANAAMAALLALGFTEEQEAQASKDAVASVEAALKGFKGLGHRMERIGVAEGVSLINNSMCTNPSAVVASSRSLPAHQHLLIGGLTKNLDFSTLREYLEVSRHDAYLFGADVAKINEQLGRGFPVFRTMAQAFEAARGSAKPGEVIMLAPGCASMDQFADFRSRGDEFKRLAKEWLEHDQIAAH